MNGKSPSVLPPSYDGAIAPSAISAVSRGPQSTTPAISRKPVASRPESTSSYVPSTGPGKLPLQNEQDGEITRSLSNIALTHRYTSTFPLSQSQLVSSSTSGASAKPGYIQRSSTTSNLPTPSRTSSAKTATLSALKTGFEEARHFAGGLMHHPVESTKHYSVLRHSHGLVYYQGSSTSIALSIFSDRSLPKGRMLWLQSKGWTGHTGLKMKALVHSTGDWIDVTPSSQILSSQVDANNERAWQRDIKQFLKKAEGNASKHKIRETVILRVPVEAQDGYWRAVLCDERKKTLCPSPIFRVASMSGSPSSLRGASLGNLPLEIGANILSTVGNAHVQAIVSPITQSVSSTMQSAIPYQPGFVEQQAGTMLADEAYTRSGAQERVDAAGVAYEAARNATYTSMSDQSGDVAASGPQKPFPVTLTSQIVAGTGYSSTHLGVPTANLRSIPADVAHRFCGHYFGWSRTVAQQTSSTAGRVKSSWYLSVISILPDSRKAATVAASVHKVAAVYMIHDFQDANLAGTNIEIRILGIIRPHVPPTATAETGYNSPTTDDALLAAVEDIAFTQSILERPGWGPDAGMNQDKPDLTARYVDTRAGVMKQIDRVPTAGMGIRSSRDTLKDRAVGRGGVFIVRDW